MGASDTNKNASKWSIRGGLLPNRTDEADAFVDMWKKLWLAGADACWADKLSTNPHAENPARAAWQAGWDWAKDQPNRRKMHHLRLAHPKRRATDLPGRVSRTVTIGAFGIGLLAASRWVWRRLRSRKPNEAIGNAPPKVP